MSEPVVSVIVAARDAAATLPATLAALNRQDIGEPYEVIVVDNGSRDETGQIAQRAPGPVSVLARRRGEGPGVARNEGAAAARAPVLAFTDSDCAPQPGWLRAGLAQMPGNALVQGAVRPPAEGTPGPFDHTVWVVSESGLYETANLFVDRSAFEQVGGFTDVVETGDGRPFAEDVWLAWRIKRAGGGSAFAPEAVVEHAILPRGAGGFIAERRRAGNFCGLLERVPELRDGFLWGRCFLSSRTAAFDAALLAGLGAAAVGSVVPLIAAAPYVWMLARRALRGGASAPVVAAVDLAGDAVAACSLAAGTARTRSVVL